MQRGLPRLVLTFYYRSTRCASAPDEPAYLMLLLRIAQLASWQVWLSHDQYIFAYKIGTDGTDASKKNAAESGRGNSNL